jgi:hypothetical protein
MSGSFQITAGHDFAGPFGPNTAFPYGSGNGDVTGSWVLVSGSGATSKGTFNPAPSSIGSAQVQGAYFIDPSELGNLYFTVILQGTLAQSYFTSISFTDDNSTVETYNTASATGFSSSAFSGYSVWYWYLPGVFVIPISSGNTYTMNYVGGVTFTTPTVTGLTVAAATAAILAAAGGFTLGTVTNVSGFPLGIVSAQSPTGGTSEGAGVPVNLSVNAGPVSLHTTFVSQAVGKSIMTANPGTINPRAYVPLDDSDARVPLPRLPL